MICLNLFKIIGQMDITVAAITELIWLTRTFRTKLTLSTDSLKSRQRKVLIRFFSIFFIQLFHCCFISFSFLLSCFYFLFVPFFYFSIFFSSLLFFIFQQLITFFLLISFEKNLFIILSFIFQYLILKIRIKMKSRIKVQGLTIFGENN